DPVASCSDVWHQGALGTPVPKQLVACVLQTGAIGVFPRAGRDTCGGLGIAPLPPSYAAEARRFAGLQDAIVKRLGVPSSGSSKRGPQCVGQTAAIAFVRHVLEPPRFPDWDLQSAG